jgi:deoxyribonuclease V
MILATDVHYHADNSATAAGIGIDHWQTDSFAWSGTAKTQDIAPYRPGHFYERELPCLLALLETAPAPDLIIVDSYVSLGPDHRDGLGARLYHALDAATPVIGVAKTRFAGTPPDTEVLRGSSHQPLFVTAIGLPLADAKSRITALPGPYRIPALLAAVDRLARQTAL